MRPERKVDIEDYLSYDVPEEWRQRGNVHTLYAPIPKNSRNIDFDIYDFQMLFDDELTTRLIRTGNTIGCFYIESPGMRSLLKRLDVQSFEMLTAASSIIRPGVAESGMMQEFIARHKDPSRRKYLIPQMERYLGETYGVMIYQEDVIKIAHHVAGLSLEEADLLRRAMSGKMRSHQAMQQITEKFFSSSRMQGLTNEQAFELWRQIESFAGYSFCKAHSASFALLSFQVAFLKAHYTAQFMAGVLSNGGGFYSAGVYIQEAKRMGLKIKLPCINHSRYEYTGYGKVLRIGFLAVKNLSRNSAEAIIKEREENGKYVSLPDFLVRTKLKYEETALLIKCGALDCLNKTRPTLLRLLDIYLKHRKMLDENYYDLFINDSYALEREVDTPRNFTLEEICRHEMEIFDYMVTRHPLHFFKEWVDNPSIIPAGEMDKHLGKQVKMIGWYMASKRIRTRKGDIMKFLSLEDLTGTFEAVIFPNAYARCAEKTMSMGPYLLTGKVDRENSCNLIVDDLEVLSALVLKSNMFKDSVDHNYYGDKEVVTEEDFLIVNALGKEQLRKAYAG